MTIITKPITEKKLDKSDLPLVYKENEANDSAQADIEASAPCSSDDLRLLVVSRRTNRVSTATTLCLFLTALTVLSIGVISGVYLYRQYARAQMHRFRGWCSIPYDGTKATMYMGDQTLQAQQEPLMSDSELLRSISQETEAEMNSLNNHLGSFFKEEFELDLDEDDYEKIDVPDFRDGRKGRFIHDFNANKTGIIDTDGHRCFVMPLNRQLVLPPRSLFDLIRKMWDGYYEVNTEVVRETMRVVTPPVADMSTLGAYIGRECKGLPTYELEKYIGGVVKRSADLMNNAKFAQYAGVGIMEIDISNLDEAINYEENNNV